MLEKRINFENLQAKDIMCTQPKTIQIDALAYDALQMMEKHNISQLVIMDGQQYKGIIHIHEIIKEGIVYSYKSVNIMILLILTFTLLFWALSQPLIPKIPMG